MCFFDWILHPTRWSAEFELIELIKSPYSNSSSWFCIPHSTVLRFDTFCFQGYVFFRDHVCGNVSFLTARFKSQLSANLDLFDLSVFMSLCLCKY